MSTKNPISTLNTNQQKDPKKLNDNSFAHLHSDSRLQGSFLQGSDFTDTTNVINYYLDLFKNDSEFREAKEILESAQVKFKGLSKYLQLIKDIPARTIDFRLQKGRDVPELLTLSQSLLNDLDNPENDGNLFFPGGWIGIPGKSGHAMMYELRKVVGEDGQNKILLLRHNTGDGIQFHQKKKDIFKDKYSPIQVFEFNDTPVNRTALQKQIIPELLLPQVVPSWVDPKTTPYSLIQRFDYTSDKIYLNTTQSMLSKNVIGYDLQFFDSKMNPEDPRFSTRYLNSIRFNKNKVMLIRYKNELWVYGKGKNRHPTFHKLGKMSDIPNIESLEKYFSDPPKLKEADEKYEWLYDYIAEKHAHFPEKEPYPIMEGMDEKESKSDSKEKDDSEICYTIPIGKSVQDIHRFVQEYIPGQRSGTCAMRILIEVLANLLPRPLFLKFLYKLKNQSLIDYYENQKQDDRLKDPIVQGLLRPALEKFARHIDQIEKQSKKKTLQVQFSKQEEIAGRELIESLTSGLNAAILAITEKETKKHTEKDFVKVSVNAPIKTDFKEKNELKLEREFKTESENVFTFNVPLKTTPEPKQDNEPKEIGTSITLPSWEPNKKESFEHFLDHCLKVTLENEKNGHSLAVISTLENLFLSLPTTRLEFFKQFIEPMIIANKDSKEVEAFAKNCFDKLTQLMGHYRKNTAKHFDFPFPKRIITTMSAINVARNLNQMVWNANEFWQSTKSDYDKVPIQESIAKFLSSYHFKTTLKDGIPTETWFKKESIHNDKPYRVAIQEFQQLNPSFMATYEYNFDRQYQKLLTTFKIEQSEDDSFRIQQDQKSAKFLGFEVTMDNEKKSIAEARKGEDQLITYSGKNLLRLASYDADNYLMDRIEKFYPGIHNKVLQFAIEKLGPLPRKDTGEVFISNINKWKCATLYQIANGTFEAPDSLKNDPEFQLVLSEFAFSLKTRDVATHGIEVVQGEEIDQNTFQFMEDPNTRFKKVKVEISDSGFESIEIVMLDESYHPGQRRDIAEAHPIIEDPELKNLLEQERLTDNEAHLDYRKKIAQKISGVKHKAPILRLAHARVNTGSQITSTIETLIDSPALLREQDYRNYLMLNDFQPDVLGPFLNDNPEYINVIIGLIQQTVFYFTDGQKIDPAGLYALSLGATLEKYLNDFIKAHQDDSAFLKTLNESLTTLSSFLDRFLRQQLTENNKNLDQFHQQMENVPKQDTNINQALKKKETLIRQGEIYRIIFLRFQTRFDQRGSMTSGSDQKFQKEEINSLIEAIFYQNTIPRSQTGLEVRTFNPNEARRNEEFINRCAPIFKDHFHSLSKEERDGLLTELLRLLPETLLSLKRVSEGPLKWQGTYPIFELELPDSEKLSFDCQKMLFKRKNSSFKPIPDYFYGNKSFVHCFGMKERVVEVYDGLDYFCAEFKNEDGYDYRIIAHQPNDIIIQRKFNNQWLQLQDPELLKTINLPKTLKSGDFQCWAGKSLAGGRLCHITQRGAPSRACFLEDETGKIIGQKFSSSLSQLGISKNNLIADLKKYCDTDRPKPEPNTGPLFYSENYKLNVISINKLPSTIDETFKSLIPLVIKCNDKFYICGYPDGRDSGKEPKITELKINNENVEAYNKFFDNIQNSTPRSLQVEEAYSIYLDIFHDIRKSRGHKEEREDSTIIYSGHDNKLAMLIAVGENLISNEIITEYKIGALIRTYFPEFDDISSFPTRQRINDFLISKNNEAALKLLERINALFKNTDDFISITKEIWRHRSHNRDLKFMEEHGVFTRLETAIQNMDKIALVPWKVDALQNKTNYALMDYNNPEELDNKILNFFARMESPDFLEVWKSHPYNKEQPYLIALPRYNLEFMAKIDPKSNELYFESKNPIGYRMRMPKAHESPWIKELPGFEAFLPLERVENNKVIEHVVLIPEQQFLPSEDKDIFSAYYKLNFDKSNTVTSTLLENHYRKERNLPELKNNEKNALNMEKWKPLNSESYRVYSVSKKGQIVGKSAEDQLYLAYLQLANHKPELALATLKACQKDLTGSKQQIELLRRIMLEIPFKSQQERNLALENRVTFSYPEVIAVRAFSAYLISQFKLNKKEIKADVYPELKRLTDDNYKEYDQKLNDERIVQFYNQEFYTAAYSIYQQYCNCRGNIPEFEMQLSGSAEESLADQIFSYPDNRKEGNLAYRAKVLELRSLERNRHNLLRAKKDVKEYAHEIKSLEENILQLRAYLFKQDPNQYPRKAIPRVVELPKTKNPPYDLAQELGLRTKIEEWASLPLVDEKSSKEPRNIFDEEEIKAEKEPFIAEFMRSTNEDYAAGIQKNKDLRQERQGLLQWLKEDSNRKGLDEKLANISEDVKQFEKLKKEIELFASSNLLGDRATEKQKRKILARRIDKPQLASLPREDEPTEVIKPESLFGLFLQRDFEGYKKVTGLDDEGVKSLHEQIHQYLLLATQLQHKKRIAALLKKLNESKLTIEQRQALTQELADQINAKRCYSEEDSEIYYLMLLWEFYEDKLIRPLQKDLIADLLVKVNGQYKSQVIQMLMGSGKTKVLWTLLAMSEADGVNLPIILDPRSLLEPTYNDLVSIVSKFNKKCHIFDFSREKPIDGKYLELLYKNLLNVIRDRNFLIASPESLKALQLKFIEIVSKKPETQEELNECSLEEWHSRVKNLTNILRLIAYQSTFLVDEADTVINNREELNYTFGDSVSINRTTCQTIIQLFNLIEKHFPKIYDIIKRPDVSLSDQEWQTFFDKLTHHCIEDESSPLFSVCNQLSLEIKADLKNYLLDKTTKLPDSIKNIPAEQKETIDLIKGYLSDILPLTLKNKKDLNFGFSRLPERKNYEIAIPYIANLIPNESSRFEMPEISLAYTLMLHKDPQYKISISTTQKLLIDFYDRVEKEMKLALESGQTLERKNTKAALEFSQLTGTHLSDFPLEDSAKCQEFREKYGHITKIKDHCLINYILPDIAQYEEVLRCNSHNLMSMPKSAQATTGTPWNIGTFPEYLFSSFNKRGSLGTDGQTMDLLISKNSPLYAANTKSPGALLKALFDESQSKDRTRAFIDVGAMFTGISNKKVAKEFVDYFRTNNFPIKFVLYFNRSNELCALPTNYLENNLKPIVLKSTNPDYISSVLGCPPSQWFTYYDQFHTTGIDIRQAINANAFLTLASKTLKRDFLQGAFRMRGLASGQTLEVALSPEIAKNVIGKDIKDCNIVDVTKMTIINQQKRLAEDHFASALQEMKNFVRDDLLKRILNCEDPNQQHEKMQCCHDTFFQKTITSATARFGGVKSEPETKDLLEEFAKSCKEQWEKMIKDAGFDVIDKEVQALQTKIDHCVQSSLPKCLKNTRTRSLADKMPTKHDEKAAKDIPVLPTKLDSTTEVQTQTKSEAQRQQQNELENQEAIASHHLHAVRHPPWKQEELNFPINKFLKSRSLNEMVLSQAANINPNSKPQKTLKDYTWRFSEAIRVSPQFQIVHTEQSYYRNPDYMANKKPLQFYLIIEDSRGIDVNLGEKPQYMALLITPLEREQLISRGHSDPNSKIKISIRTAHGHYSGCDKIDTNNEQCMGLMEQIAYFNGDAHLLSRQVTSSQWFNKLNPQEVNEKIGFLEKQILPSHPDKSGFVAGLKENLDRFVIAPTKLFLHEAEKSSIKKPVSPRPLQQPGTDSSQKTRPEIDRPEIDWW